MAVELELDSLVKEIPSLIERLNQEYNKFFSGQEHKAPARLREQLEVKIDRLRSCARLVQSAAEKFRAQSMLSSYTSRAATWDGKMRDRESTRSS